MSLNFTDFLSLLFPFFSFPFFLSTLPSFSSLLFYISLPIVHPLSIYHLSIIHLFIHLLSSFYPSFMYLLFYPSIIYLFVYLPTFYSVILWPHSWQQVLYFWATSSVPFHPSWRQGCIKLCKLTLNLLSSPSRLLNLWYSSVSLLSSCTITPMVWFEY